MGVIKERTGKEDICTIPNMLSFVRILLIPVIIVLYCVYEKYLLSVAFVLISGFTDILDGFIARKFGQISDFGKFIDPVADKLTQGAMIFCLLSTYPAIIILFFIMLIKETVMFICGYVALSQTNSMSSAKWYGKLNTLLLYSVMLVLFSFPTIDRVLAYALIGLCMLSVIISGVLYGRFFCRQLKIK